MEIPETPQSTDLTLFAGRDQALTLIAGTCSAAQAQYLKEVRESGAAAQAGLTWDDYCDAYVGRSRAQVNRLIRQLEQFGPAYFHFCQIAPLSARTFHRLKLATHISGNRFEVYGKSFEISPTNGRAIRDAIKALRAESQQQEPALPQEPPPAPPPANSSLAPPDPDPPSPSAILTVLDDFYRAAARGDRPAYLALFAPGAVFLGVRPQDHYFLPQLRLLGFPFEPRDQAVSFSAGGDAAWFDESVVSEDGRPHRTTGVLVRLEGGWKIAQFSISALVAPKVK